MRIGIVVQRYGPEINGGAELLARWLAEHLATTHEVTVFTTCAADYVTWANEYSAGNSTMNGVSLRRFPVDAPRNWQKSQKMVTAVLNGRASLPDQVEWVRQQGPYSTELIQAVQRGYREFDAFLFFTFHYATTFFGLPLVSDKAILVPTAHEDPFLHLPVFRPLFHLPRAIVYLTESERDLVQRVVHNEDVPHTVAAISMDGAIGRASAEGEAGSKFRAKYGIDGDFLLYVGRLHESKNVPELLEFFAQYRTDSAGENQQSLKLVLLGKSHLDLPQHPDIVTLGFVSDEDKFGAIEATAMVVNPSRYESLSIIALESLALGTPILVNGDCDVLMRLCKRSHGGLYYHNYEEFAAIMTLLLKTPELRHTLGQQGQSFVAQNYRSEAILSQYEMLLGKIRARKTAVAKRL